MKPTVYTKAAALDALEEIKDRWLLDCAEWDTEDGGWYVQLIEKGGIGGIESSHPSSLAEAIQDAVRKAGE